jgi:hypothetical protein
MRGSIFSGVLTAVIVAACLLPLALAECGRDEEDVE